MIRFSIEEYELRALCHIRIIFVNGFIVTTLDYQSFDSEAEANNDELYFFEKYRKNSGWNYNLCWRQPLNDVVITFNNGIRIVLYKNGYHHFNDEEEQWIIFKFGDRSYPFVTVYKKTVDIAYKR